MKLQNSGQSIGAWMAANPNKALRLWIYDNFFFEYPKEKRRHYAQYALITFNINLN